MRRKLEPMLILVNIPRICIGRSVDSFFWRAGRFFLHSCIRFHRWCLGQTRTRFPRRGYRSLKISPLLGNVPTGVDAAFPQQSSSHLRLHLSHYLLEFGCLPRRVHRRVWQTITHSLRLDRDA